MATTLGSTGVTFPDGTTQTTAAAATTQYVKAWVNFNGTGTVAIRASFNVSSITDNGTGDYTVNFTTAMPDANFSAAGTAANDQSGGTFVGLNDGRRTVTTLRVTTKGVTESLFDCPIVNVAIFR